MRRLVVSLLAVMVLMVVVSCTPPPKSTLVEAITLPVLPTYVVPTATPEHADTMKVLPGQLVLLANDEGKRVQIRYLGSDRGYDHWQCSNSNGGHEGNCQGHDIEIHHISFYWDWEHQAAWSGDMSGGELKLNARWHVVP